ncbi:prolow-density lipoprotein receptor-related protein 1-like [Mytilus trossulus]|uniref:prolow-density lipoprotein receptor-related protein 1-like n=1 Tax=Mytilus trossulus TaxID=6551 RepID=UPI003006F45F
MAWQWTGPWIGQNLFWCNKIADTIEVSRLDGSYRKILIEDGLQEPRGLEVHPLRGYLFYTDWGDQPHISRAHMDGTHIERIITQNLAWPNGLTIDYVTEKIFWSDASLDYISMADLDGSNQFVVINKNLPHTFALTTFMDYIFWTDWESKSINRAHKFSGENRTTIVKTSHRPMDIQVYHKMRQTKEAKQFTGQISPVKTAGYDDWTLISSDDNEIETLHDARHVKNPDGLAAH